MISVFNAIHCDHISSVGVKHVTVEQALLKQQNQVEPGIHKLLVNHQTVSVTRLGIRMADIAESDCKPVVCLWTHLKLNPLKRDKKSLWYRSYQLLNSK